MRKIAENCEKSRKNAEKCGKSQKKCEKMRKIAEKAATHGMIGKLWGGKLWEDEL